jgi:hypothetical protein
LKTFLTTILSLLFLVNTYSQNTDSSSLAQIEDIFKWDIETLENGSMMFLDVAYQRDNTDSTEYLTLTVAKDKTKDRPAFISIIIPNNIVQSNGIFITFANSVTKNGERTMELTKEKPVRIKFESCGDETCTARVVDGYGSRDNGEKVDIFQKFLEFDHVLLLVIYPDGSHKSIAVPLFSFKKQYKEL